MSDEETQGMSTGDSQMLTAEYNDGQLQIVEVAAFDKGRYVQVLDSDKGVMNLDLLSLIKSEGSSTFQLVGTTTDDADDTVTCVLTNHENESEEGEKDSYVIVNSEDGRDPLVYLQSSLQQINNQQTHRSDDKKKKKPLTQSEILEKAKMLTKLNVLGSMRPGSRTGRKRKGEFPPPTEMLSLLTSPGFKLYLYSCKLCSFKCNAIKEMSKHKETEHSGRRAGAGRSAAGHLQCAQCPYRAAQHMQLVKHVKDKHGIDGDEECSTELILDCDDVSEADVLVCGACGFESGDRGVFRRHIEATHGLDVTLSPAIVTLTEETSEPN